MSESVEHLQAMIEYLGVSKSALARALYVDASLVSRWLSGERRLRAASQQMEAMVEFVLSRSKHVSDIKWLRERFIEAGLPTELSSAYQIKQNLIMWLASDGDELRRNLGDAPLAALPPRRPPLAVPPVRLQRAPIPPSGDMRIGILDVALALEGLLGAAEPGDTLDIFLSSDQLATVTDDEIVAQVTRAANRGGRYVRLMVCVSGETRAMSRLISAYMSAIAAGTVRVYVVRGTTQTVTRQLHAIIPGRAAMLVTETPGGQAPPVATVVREPSFIREAGASFEASLRYAQPVLSVYGDEYTRDILEILFMEYCTPGALDVVKDSINPMYMSRESYSRFLGTRGHGEEENAWRGEEFGRFKAGNQELLRSGAVFREIIPRSRLDQVVRDGFCRMPGLYYMERGYVSLDARGCADILSGYIDCLEEFPGFHLLILDDITPLRPDNCWHIKRDQSLALNDWSGETPIMIHSDQMLLLREFQAKFAALWERGERSVSRAGVIATLVEAIRRLEFACGNSTESLRPEMNGGEA